MNFINKPARRGHLARTVNRTPIGGRAAPEPLELVPRDSNLPGTLRLPWCLGLLMSTSGRR